MRYATLLTFVVALAGCTKTVDDYVQRCMEHNSERPGAQHYSKTYCEASAEKFFPDEYKEYRDAQ